MTEINVEKLADPRFYLENFCKIKNKEGKGLVPFILKPAQLDIFNTIQKNNRVIIMKARQIGFCVSPHTKILLSNLEWTTVEDIKVGQGIVCVDEFPIKKGKGGMRKMRDGVVEAKQIVYEDAFKLKMDNGSELTATGLHKFLFLKNKTETEWKTVKEMSPGDSIRYITEVNPEPNFEDGWFSGMIDGEGSLSKKTRTGSLLSISQVDGPVWDRLVRYAEKNKYSYRIEIDKRIPQNSGKHGEQPVNKLIIGKMDELLRLFATIRPHRLINRKWWENKQIPNNGWSKIISIEFLGKREMIDLQTSEKTFIANGFVSHNSTAVTGFLYHKTITTPGVTTALIGYNNDLTAELLDKIKTFYRTTPDVLKPTIHYNTKYEISFPKVDSKILVLPSTENVGRGYTINFCLCTEIPFWEKAEEKMVTLEASVPITGKLILESSPGSIGDYFHRMWVSDNDYIKKEYGWWWDYNEEEIEIIRRRMNNLRKFNNNYALEFLISGRSVFTTEAIATQRKRVLKVGDKVKLEDGTEHIVREEEGFRIYKPEVKDHFYVFGCLPDGEKVLTNKGLMSIEDVRLTEKLIDKEGNLVNIKNIQRRYYEGEVYGINPNITVIETKFTPEHPILVLKDNKLYRTSKKKGGARFYKTDVTWKKAKNINKNDILKIPIRFKESLKNEEILTHFPAQDNIRIDRRIDPKIILTESFWFFIGFWLAEGWINNTNDYGIAIHLSLVKEKDLAKKMCKEIRKLFNRNVTPCYRTSSNVIDIKFSSEVIYNFIKNNFGQKAIGKDIKEWIKYLPSPLKIALFNGYRTGDGGTSVVKKDGRNIISCVSISKKLLYDFQEILLSLGLLSNLSRLRKSGIREIRGTKSFTQETYQLRLSSRETSVLLKKDYNFSRGRHIGYSWIEGNFLYLKIKKIDKYDYRGYVNNFETETHSYCAPMMVVHNCDCSEGVTGGDYSVAVILDRNTGEEVAMWRGLTAPDKFAKILDKWGRKYNNALMVVESEAHGNVVLNVLKQGLYPSLYFRPSRFDTIGNPFSDKLGWKTTKITRPILIDEFEMMTRQDDIILHSKETVDEMTTFIFNDANNMVAMQSYHDDQIFATAIAIQGFKVLSNKPMTQLNYSQHLPAVGY